MGIEDHPHFIALSMFALSLIVVALVKNVGEPSSPWTLIGGIVLVGLGAWALNGFTIMEGFYLVLQHAGKIDASQFKTAHEATSLWALLLPAVVAAMGANLITSWSLSKKVR